jgi:hypothetical protein
VISISVALYQLLRAPTHAIHVRAHAHTPCNNMQHHTRLDHASRTDDVIWLSHTRRREETHQRPTSAVCTVSLRARWYVCTCIHARTLAHTHTTSLHFTSLHFTSLHIHRYPAPRAPACASIPNYHLPYQQASHQRTHANQMHPHMHLRIEPPCGLCFLALKPTTPLRMY